MENLSSNFSEDFGYSEQLVNTDTAADSYFNGSFGPGDEDEEEDGKEAAEQPNEDDPPLDEEVVHSPVTTQTGGLPKTAPSN